MNREFAEEREQRDPVGALLQLARRARHAATRTELGFLAVNETHALVPYRQAALWLSIGGVKTLSGVVAPEANAPFVQWLDRIATRLASHDFAEPTVIAPDMLLPADAAEWDEWLPAHAMWLPIGNAKNREEQGGLLLARDEPWQPGEVGLLTEWLDIWQHAWLARRDTTDRPDLLRWFTRPRTEKESGTISWKQRLLGLHPREIWRSPVKRYTTLVLLVAFVPVRLSVLVGGELVPSHPAAIRAPMDGTVDRFFVAPNQSVQQDEVLFQLDLSALKSKLEVARQELATAEAEYRQSAQQAVFDARVKPQLAVLQGRISERTTEVEFLGQQLARAQVTAPRSGVVLMDDPSEWIGKPVAVGERVLTIADAHEVEVEAWLTPADAIDLPERARVTLYVDAAPLNPVHAEVRYVAYEAIARPDGSYAYRVRATIIRQDFSLRVGLKGTARIAGNYVPLVYWIARKPIAAVRPWLGW